LQRKILKAEAQLANQASFSEKETESERETDSDKETDADKQTDVEKETDSQTEEILPLKMVNKSMIAPGARDAPKFSSRRPQELRRFLRQMEDLWKEANIETDEDKKESIVKYVDQEGEEEWMALETYEKGSTWEEFKNELIANYPEAAAAEPGTPARLRHLCAETKGIRLGDLTTLYAFRRAFAAEAKKLAKPPAAMSNRELVELFIGILSELMAAAVLQFLGNKSGVEKPDLKGKATEPECGKPQRRPEDKYDLEEVCKAAIQVSESSQGMFYIMNKASPELVSERRVMMLNQPVSEASSLNQKLEEIKNIQAQERDKLAITNKNIDS
jgi:hypothetical protein